MSRTQNCLYVIMLGASACGGPEGASLEEASTLSAQVGASENPADAGAYAPLIDAARHSAEAPPPARDEGLACELRHRYRTPRPDSCASSLEPWLDLPKSSNAVAVAADGSAYVIGSFGRELDLGAATLRADAPVSGFLHKVDADCKPVRTQLLSASTRGDLMTPVALTIDRQGSVYVLSQGGGKLIEPSLNVSPRRWGSEIVVEKFSPDGESLYRFRAATGERGIAYDIEVDAEGRAYVAGLASASTDLGAGSFIGGSPTAFHTFLLALDASGHYRGHTLDTQSTEIELASDRVVAIGPGVGSFESDFSKPTHLDALPTFEGLAARATADLEPEWTVYIPLAHSEAGRSAEGLRSGGIAIAFLAPQLSNHPVASWDQVVQRYGADGGLLNSTAFIQEVTVDPGTDAGIGLGHTRSGLTITHMKESEPGALAMLGMFYSDFQLAGVSLEVGHHTIAPLTPHKGAAVMKVGADDRLRWVREQVWGEQTWVAGIDSLPSGEVYLAGLTLVPGTANERNEGELEFVIRKLRAD